MNDRAPHGKHAQRLPEPAQEAPNVTVESMAHFGFFGESQAEVIAEVRRILATFVADGVANVRVEPGPNDSIQIVLVMRSHDLGEADANADAAAESILELLRNSGSAGHLRERQRELVLA